MNERDTSAGSAPLPDDVREIVVALQTIGNGGFWVDGNKTARQAADMLEQQAGRIAELEEKEKSQ